MRIHPSRLAARRLLMVVIPALAACTTPPEAQPVAQPHVPVSLANPATAHCLRAGGQTSTVRDADGAERGLCTLASGQRCDQWAFFRGECGPPRTK